LNPFAVILTTHSTENTIVKNKFRFCNIFCWSGGNGGNLINANEIVLAIIHIVIKLSNYFCLWKLYAYK